MIAPNTQEKRFQLELEGIDRNGVGGVLWASAGWQDFCDRIANASIPRVKAARRAGYMTIVCLFLLVLGWIGWALLFASNGWNVLTGLYFGGLLVAGVLMEWCREEHERRQLQLLSEEVDQICRDTLAQQQQQQQSLEPRFYPTLVTEQKTCFREKVYHVQLNTPGADDDMTVDLTDDEMDDVEASQICVDE